MLPRSRVLDKLDALLRSNDYAGAKRLLQYWLEDARVSNDDHGVLLMQNELMGLCRKLGEREQALQYAQDALDQVARMDIADNVGAATTFLNSATVCKAFGLPQDAINLFQMAQRIYERDLPPDDERLAGLYNNMGLALVDLGEFAQADALYRKALAVLQPLQDKQPEQAVTYLNMATAAETQHGLPQAADTVAALLEQAMTCLDSCRDRSDGNYAFVCEKCAPAFERYGYTAYAEQLQQRTRRIYEGT